MLDKFSVAVFNQVIKSHIAPVVDRFLEQLNSDIVAEALSDLIAIHTDFQHLIEEKVFSSKQLLPLMFGCTSSAGLRQQAIRKVLYTSLFEKPVASLAKTVHDLQGKIIPLSPVRTKRHLIPQNSTKKRPPRGGGGAGQIQIADHKTNNALSDHTPQEQGVDLSKETLSEPEMSSNVRSSTPFPNRDHEEERLNR